MATVRFSKDLKHYILSNAKKTFDGKVKLALDNIDREKVYEGIKKEFKQEHLLISKIDNKYFNDSANTIDIKIIDIVTDDNFETKEVSTLINNFRLPNPVHVPRQYGKPLIQVDLFNEASDLTKYAGATLRPYYAEAASMTQRMNTIETLMENYGSLNKALEHWGLLEQFVPAQYMNRVRQIEAPRTRTKKEKVEIDKNILNGMTVAIMTDNLTDD